MRDTTLSILIVEDDPVIASDLTFIMKDLGYAPFPPLRNADDVMLMLKHARPDCIIMDVSLEGKTDGIDLAAKIKAEYNIPVVFLTAHHDRHTIDRIKAVQPSAYLVKPIETHTLQTTVELALYNASHQKLEAAGREEGQDDYISGKYFFIKVKNQLRKILLDEILYLEAYDNYSNLFTADSKYIIGSNLKSIESRLSEHGFVRVHRSYLVHLTYVDGIEDEWVLIGKHKIPIGKTYRDDFMKHISLL